MLKASVLMCGLLSWCAFAAAAAQGNPASRVPPPVTQPVNTCTDTAPSSSETCPAVACGWALGGCNSATVLGRGLCQVGRQTPGTSCLGAHLRPSDTVRMTQAHLHCAGPHVASNMPSAAQC
jgi:hypothetical protein